MAHNELIVTQGADHPLLYSKNAVGTDATWISGEAPAGEFDCTCKYRYRQPSCPSSAALSWLSAISR